jgi:hypothetical protein
MFEMHLVTNRHEALRALALLRASHPAPLSVDIETYTHDHNGDALDRYPANPAR